MRIPRQMYCALCVASLTAVSMPPVAFGHGSEHQQSDYQSPAKYDESQNLAPTQFYTQAERDLVARVRDHLVTDPILAPVERNVAIDAEVGTITLRGSLPTQAEKERAINITEHVLGVGRVNDEIRVTRTASMSPSVAPSQESTSRESSVTTTRVTPRAALVAPQPEPPVAGFPPTEGRGVGEFDDQSLPGSGRMANEDRTGSSGPSGTRSTSPLNTGAIDPVGRVAKPAGDYAVTEVDRGLQSQVRVALNGNPNLPVNDGNVHLVVDNGFVTLEGWVPNERDSVAIAECVRGVTGVQGVDNQLRVGPNEGLPSRARGD